MKRHKFNENYFTKIDTEDKAYFLGLLYADGNVSSTENCVEISLQEQDVDILYKFKNYLNSESPIRYREYNNNWSNQYRFKFTSSKTKSDLIKLGCLPKKSLIIKFPSKQQINTKYLQHFVRGYFDGDGSLVVSLRKKKRKRLDYPDISVSIASTKDFCDILSQILKTKLDINSYIIQGSRKNNITYTITISGNNQVVKFLDWLYQEANVYLDRKYKKYLESKKLLENYYGNS